MDSIISEGRTELTSGQLQTAVLTLFLPNCLVKHLNAGIAEDKPMKIRCQVLRLLTTILNQLCAVKYSLNSVEAATFHKNFSHILTKVKILFGTGVSKYTSEFTGSEEVNEMKPKFNGLLLRYELFISA